MNFFRLIKIDKAIRNAFSLTLLVTILLCFGYIVGFLRYYSLTFTESNQSKVDIVTNVLEKHVSRANSYGLYVNELDGTFDETSFLNFTGQLFSEMDSIDIVTLAPAGSIEFVYPASEKDIYLGNEIVNDFSFDEKNLFLYSMDSKEPFVTISSDEEFLIIHQIIFDSEDDFLALSSIYINIDLFVMDLPDHFDVTDFVVYLEPGLFLVGDETILTDSFRIEHVDIEGLEFHMGSDYLGSFHERTVIILFVITLLSLIPLLVIFGMFYSDQRVTGNLFDELDYQKNYNSSTGLKNNTSFYRDIEKLIGTNTEFYMALGAFNNVKYINDKYGHKVGQRLVVRAISLIQGVLRSHTEIYHYGGDEYVIVVQTTNKNEVSNILRRVLKVFERDIVIDRIRTNISMTIGVVHYPTQGLNPDELVKNAHITQSSSRISSRNVYEFYNKRVFGNRETNQDFDKYVDSLNLELFEVYLMPIIDVQTNRIVGFECLSRANNEFGEKMDTEMVVNSLERNGRIQELDEIVFKKLLIIMRRINKDFPDQDYFLSVNASALSFNEKYVETVISLYEQEQFKKGTLVLELTESYKVDDYDYLIRLFEKLNRHGIKTAIDDFGSGYSSLSYISKFPIYAIKVDKSYVRDYDTNDFNRTLFLTLKSIADVLNCKLVAEGVDDPDTLRFLKEHDCELYQGYLFSKGVPFNEALKMIKKNIKDTKK